MIGYVGVEEQVDRDFDRALLKASLRRLKDRLRRDCAYDRLLSFDEAKGALARWSQAYRGMRTVEVEKITGSVGRYRDFDSSFLPLKVDMGDRWGRIDRAYHRGVELPAVSLYKIGEAYFVRDGNHRVSVARYHGVAAIDAEVVELSCGRNDAGGARRQDRPSGGGGDEERTSGSPGDPPRGRYVSTPPTSTFRTGNREGEFRMMSRLSSVVKQYPLITFFVLAFALSWWPIPFYAAGLSPSPIIGFGPFLAALVVLAVAQGKSGVVSLLRRIVRWRVGFRWYIVALVLPVVISGAAAALNVLLFGAQASSAVLSGWTGLFSTFALLLLIPGIGGSWEEPGWRGYALPRLQAGRSALSASLILGVVWALWHLPLMVIGQIPLSDPLFIVASTVVFTWLFNNAHGSVLIAMLMHNMNNVISGGYFSAMFSGADWVRQGWLLVALWCAVAITVVIVAGPAHLSRKHRKQEEPSQTEPAASASSQPQGIKEVLK